MFEGYQVVDKAGSGAKERFTSPDALRAVFEKLKTDDSPDAVRRAKIRKMYEGNLPFDPEKLKRAGLKNLTNVNFLGLKGTVDARADLVLKLQQDTVSLIELHPLAKELAGPELTRIGKVVAEEFSAMIRERGTLIPEFARMEKEADLYGLAPMVWPSTLSYAPVALERAQIRFIGNGPVSSSEHELVMFESTISAAYLRFLLDNQELAEAEGWNAAEVKRWLIEVFYHGKDTKESPGFESSTTAIEEALSYIRRNVLGEEQQFNTLYVIHAFVKEVAFPRGITHYIIPSQGQTNRFLFKKKDAYKTMDECFIWLPYSVKDRYAKEVRGLASFLFPVDALRNRFLCQIVDAGFRASMFTLAQQTSAVQSSALTINEHGAYAVLPPGVVPANAQFNPNLQQLVSVTQLLDKVGADATNGGELPAVGVSGPKLFAGGSSPQGLTKAEYELLNQTRSLVDQARFAQRQAVYNKIFRETFKRALKLAMMDSIARTDYPEIDGWIRRCEKRRVSLQQLSLVPEMFEVTVCHDLALGADGKIQELSAFLQLHGGSLDESGRRYIAREHAKLRFGAAEADQIIPEVSRDNAPTDQSSFALLENNQMKMGFEVMVGQDQIHWAHIPVHAQLLQAIVDQVHAPEDNRPDLNEWNGDPQQSMQIAEQTLQNLQEDPRKILGILMNCSQHIQTHLQYGGGQPGMENNAKQVQQMLRDLRPTVKALNLAVATQEDVEQAQREEQERAMQDLQKRADENEVAKAKIEADKKAETDRYRIDREHEVAMHRLALEESRAGRQDDLSDRRATREDQRRDAEMSARIDAQDRMARARENAAQAANRFDVTNQVTGMDSVSPAEVAGESVGNLNL